ncbi:fatty acid desaturas-like protein [Cadophora sp. MPI-SDFR-AT-0126]|nr:fatty acid desaturas-like protein [Leotiomycetes sp. MPI-SDFR-AT-0126]
MGWLNLRNRTSVDSRCQPPHGTIQGNLKTVTRHIETVSLDSKRSEFPFIDSSVPDDRLPLIPSEKVIKQASVEAGGLFIVIDNVVYNCTDFLMEHPGGDQIIKSFGGSECSWQFWRFHGSKEMEEFGRPLRVGRTEGISNRFQEPSKYVGLRKLGADEWD